MVSEVLSATLPENEVIRERLLARLRERFGDALFVYRERIALVADEFARKEKTFKFGRSAQQVFADAGLKIADSETIVVIGKTENERKLARFVVSEPSGVYPRKRGMFAIERKTSAGDFWAALAPDKNGLRCVLFLGTSGEKPA